MSFLIVFGRNGQSRLENEKQPEYAGIAPNSERSSVLKFRSQEGTS